VDALNTADPGGGIWNIRSATRSTTSRWRRSAGPSRLTSKQYLGEADLPAPFEPERCVLW